MIYAVAMGPGSPELLTEAAKKALKESDLFIGSRALLELVEGEKVEAISAKKIKEVIEENPGRTISVLFRGDVGFFSGAKKLLELVDAVVIPGISSFQYFFSKLKKSYENVDFVSLHGRENLSLSDRKHALYLTDSQHTPKWIAERYLEKNLTGTMSVGSNLSLENERIVVKPFDEIDVEDGFSLCYVEVDSLPRTLLRDDDFLRTSVPMTKEEVRLIALMKLNLAPTDTFLDVGAGTGSVGLTASRLLPDGSVYMVEVNDEAYETSEKNIERLAPKNVTLLKGNAKEIIGSLPKIDKTFIGGTRGSLKEILEELKKNNEHMEVVISALTLETLKEVMDLTEVKDVTMISISNSKPLGRYHMMEAKNPIYLFEVRL
ncbi:precorrin-6y C5,15-methyltransferase (decarboxylating) subunit CbiE [Guggenheimella bovis]